MPSDVEKVAICRLSGLRAGVGCREADHLTMTSTAEPMIDGSYPPQPALVPAAVTEPEEPNVYEDLFPVGAMPSETCQEHDASRSGATALTTTPLVDAALQPASYSEPPRTPGPAIRPNTRLFIERVSRPDGSIGYVVRERR